MSDIVHAEDRDVPANAALVVLLSEVERLRAEIERLRAEVEWLKATLELEMRPVRLPGGE